MKWSLLFCLTLTTIVAGDGAWKANKEYVYKLQGRTLMTWKNEKNQWSGVLYRARLSINPQSDNLLVGQIVEAEYAEIDQPVFGEWNSILNNNDMKYQLLPLNKLFKIHLRNGVIHSLSVDRTLSNHQINQLKVIVTQFQIDSRAQNVVEFSGNQLPEEDNNNAWYKTMELTVTGNCETFYDISPLPEYLIQSNSDWVPLKDMKEDGEFIEIIKTRNNKDCNERSDYNFAMTGHSDYFAPKDDNTSELDDNLSIFERSRIIISGSLKSYTIQSSVTTKKVGGIPALYEYINVKLESIVDGSTNNVGIPNENLKRTSGLVYVYNNVSLPTLQAPSRPVQFALSDDALEVWTGCWTGFVAGSTACKSEFGPEYEDIGTSSCGFLGLGVAHKCKLSFPGCVATACYTVFIPIDQLCEKSFGSDYPIRHGGFVDCSPGFYRARCCKS